MLLVVADLFGFKHVAVQQLLELYECACLMTADVPEVIGAAAADRQGLGVLEFLDINLVVGSVTVVLHPESHRLEQLIVFYQLDISDGMDLLAAPDYFIRSIGVHIFDKVR